MTKLTDEQGEFLAKFMGMNRVLIKFKDGRKPAYRWDGPDSYLQGDDDVDGREPTVWDNSDANIWEDELAEFFDRSVQREAVMDRVVEKYKVVYFSRESDRIGCCVTLDGDLLKAKFGYGPTRFIALVNALMRAKKEGEYE